MGFIDRMTNRVKQVGGAIKDKLTNGKNGNGESKSGIGRFIRPLIDTVKVIPVPAVAIQMLLRNQLDRVNGLEVKIIDDTMVLSGNVFIFIPFTIRLKVHSVQNGDVQFAITSFGPLDLEFIKRWVFSKSRICRYQNNILTINIKQIDALSKIPILKIKAVRLADSKMHVELGV